MYMAGRRRTASRPSRALMLSAVYSPFVLPFVFFGFGSFSLFSFCSTCVLAAADSFKRGTPLGILKDRNYPANHCGLGAKSDAKQLIIQGLSPLRHCDFSTEALFRTRAF